MNPSRRRAGQLARYILSSCAALAWGTPALASDHAARCADVIMNGAPAGPSVADANLNGHVPLDRYVETNDRTLSEYDYLFGRTLMRRFPVTSWLDSGAGFGLATLRAADEGHVALAVAINAQDGLRPVRDRDYDWFRQFARDKKVGLMATFGDGAAGDATVEQVDRAHRRLTRLEDQGRYRYVAAFAEAALPSVRETFALLTDPFGAYFYSPERTRLLAEYYAHLAEGGEGLVIIRGRNIKWDRPGAGRERRAVIKDYGPDNRVRRPDGWLVPFEEYLVELYPTIFSIYTANADLMYATARHRVLVIRRDPNIDALTALDHLSVESVRFGEVGLSRQIPSVTYRID